VAQIYPRALGSLSPAPYDSQGYGGGILSHLHTGKLWWITVGPAYITLRGTKLKSSLKSKLSTSNKLLVYKTIFKPIWTYRIQLWGTASTSNIEIIEHLQSKSLHMIVDTPLYVPNTVIQRDLQIPTVKEEIRHYCSQYSAHLSALPNELVVNLIELPDNR
jgi:hypothetical protein